MCILIECIVINSDSDQQKVTISPLSLLISASVRSKHGRRVNRDAGTEVKGEEEASKLNVLRCIYGLRQCMWSQVTNPIILNPFLDERRRQATACCCLI